ncbi:hypothetical protein [Modestobacter lapidis]|nr:hypothetical protein [Modestobacter lapidis]
MKLLRPPALLVSAVLLAGCSAGDAGRPPTSTEAGAPPSSSAAATSVEPGPAADEAAAAAAADPATARTAQEAALASALRAADLPAGWSVQANPVPDGDLADAPSLAGICSGSVPSEARRTAKFPVTGLDAAGTAVLASEAISYETAADAERALSELGAAFATCPPEDYTFLPGPPTAGLLPDSLAIRYELSNGVGQVVLAQVRGAVLSIVIGEEPDTTLAAAQRIADRMARLPAAVIGA